MTKGMMVKHWCEILSRKEGPVRQFGVVIFDPEKHHIIGNVPNKARQVHNFVLVLSRYRRMLLSKAGKSEVSSKQASLVNELALEALQYMNDLLSDAFPDGPERFPGSPVILEGWQLAGRKA